MALVLCWSVARLIMDSPVDLGSKPVLNGSPTADPARPTRCRSLLDAAAGGARVVVRDGAGEMVFNGDLTFGEPSASRRRRRCGSSPPTARSRSPSTAPSGARSAPQGQPAQNTFAAAGR